MMMAAADKIKSIKCDAAEESWFLSWGRTCWIVCDVRRMWSGPRDVWDRRDEEVCVVHIFGSVLKKAQKNGSKLFLKVGSAVVHALMVITNFHKNQWFILNIAIRHMFSIKFLIRHIFSIKFLNLISHYFLTLESFFLHLETWSKSW
jgi:hypothetical protein